MGSRQRLPQRQSTLLAGRMAENSGWVHEYRDSTETLLVSRHHACQSAVPAAVLGGTSHTSGTILCVHGNSFRITDSFKIVAMNRSHLC
jgi:pSer/pThr/pTyr-binding forkhead associated (FHA) protein